MGPVHGLEANPALHPAYFNTQLRVFDPLHHFSQKAINQHRYTMTDNQVLAIDKSADTTTAAALSTAAASSTFTAAVDGVASVATSKTVEEKR